MWFTKCSQAESWHKCENFPSILLPSGATALHCLLPSGWKQFFFFSTFVVAYDEKINLIPNIATWPELELIPTLYMELWKLINTICFCLVKVTECQNSDQSPDFYLYFQISLYYLSPYIRVWQFSQWEPPVLISHVFCTSASIFWRLDGKV